MKRQLLIVSALCLIWLSISSSEAEVCQTFTTADCLNYNSVNTVATDDLSRGLARRMASAVLMAHAGDGKGKVLGSRNDGYFANPAKELNMAVISASFTVYLMRKRRVIYSGGLTLVGFVM